MKSTQSCSFELTEYKCNFSLIYEGVSHNVHKDFIAFHCKTLNALLSSVTDNVIEIPKITHCSAENFKEFLSQIYPHRTSVLKASNILGITAASHWADASYVRDDCYDFFMTHQESLPLTDLITAYEVYKFKKLEEPILELILLHCLQNDFGYYEKLNSALKEKVFYLLCSKAMNQTNFSF